MTRIHLGVLLTATLATSACVKDVSPDDRLTRSFEQVDSKPTPTADELIVLRCDNITEPLAHARNENQPETERILTYIDLYSALKRNNAKFELAFARNPDFAYLDTYLPLTAARDTCVQNTADIRVEFERYVRELVESPTVQEIKGGATVTVARLDLQVLRRAVDVIDPDDRDAMVTKVAFAERRLTAVPEGPAKR